MDRRAIACFDQALADVGLNSDDALRQVLHDYFAWATTTIRLGPWPGSCPDRRPTALSSTFVPGSPSGAMHQS